MLTVAYRNPEKIHKKGKRDFPGGTWVKTSPSAAGSGSIPCPVAKIPHASGPKNQNIKQEQYCFIKFLSGPHQKYLLKKKVGRAITQMVGVGGVERQISAHLLTRGWTQFRCELSFQRC